MSSQRKNVLLNFSVTEETREMLKELAVADGRTASNCLEHLIRTEYEKMKKQRGDTEDALHRPVCAID